MGFPAFIYFEGQLINLERVLTIGRTVGEFPTITIQLEGCTPLVFNYKDMELRDSAFEYLREILDIDHPEYDDSALISDSE